MALSRFLDFAWRPGTQVSELAWIPGGASRETWKLHVSAPEVENCGMAVRIDPETSLIDTDPRTEYRVMEAVYKTGPPVPKTLFLEETPSGSAARFRSLPK